MKKLISLVAAFLASTVVSTAAVFPVKEDVTWRYHPSEVPCLICSETTQGGWQGVGQATHYLKCRIGHKGYEAMHFDSNFDVICDVCQLPISTCGLTSGKGLCMKKYLDGWQTNEINHYKLCEDGHEMYVELHYSKNGDNKCDVCNADLSSIQTPAPVEDFKWKEYDLSITKCVYCNEPVSQKWLTTNDGRHYVICSDIKCRLDNLKAPHSDQNVDLICDICTLPIVTCYGRVHAEKETVGDDGQIKTVGTSVYCTKPMAEGWKANETNHYKICTGEEAHETYINPHYTTNSDGKCDVCNYDWNLGRIAGDTEEEKENEELKSTEETATLENACPVKGCKGTIVDEWVELDGSHAKKCTNGCTLYEAIHIDSEDLICDICNLTVTKCYIEDCRALLKEGWMRTADGKHYKECMNGHPSYIKEHEFDGTKCKLCGFDKVQIKPVEMKCNKCESDAYWEQTGTMHVLVCKAQKNHVVLIEGHNIVEGECLVCKYKETEKLESSFTDLPKTHWAYRNIAYMEKLNIAKGTTYGNGEKVILPEEIIKAEEFVALIARIVGYRDLDEIPDDSVYNPFGKEIENSWTRGHWKYLLNYIEKKVGKDAKAEMMAVLANNTISGTDAEIAENYKKPITRERAVYLLGTLMGDHALRQVIGKGLADDFKDWEEVSSVSFKYKVELLSAYDVLKGVLDTGTGELYIQPKGELTRAQAIALIDRFNSIKELEFVY